MDGQAKLIRTQSSLLRSSRSFHTLPAVNHHKKPSPPPRPGPARWAPIIATAITSLTLITVYIHLNTKETATSENLLLALIFIAVALFYLSQNRELLNRSRSVLRQLYAENRKNHRSKSVQWHIGDESEPEKEPDSLRRGECERERVEFYSNGDFYEGEFEKGMCNGRGVYNYFVNGRYEGDWVDGLYDGYGIESWARGSRYRGQYRGGLRHGIGVYRFYSGDSYSGEWFNGLYNGVGLQTCSDGSCYFGEFKRGIKHGLGSYHFRNGDRYAGEYFSDKIHGFGVYHFANGHCYEGSWHEGRKQGYGMYTFRNDETKCGEWDCGSLKTPLLPLSDSVSRAVQAARKSAENAIQLRRVDEQLNKAVMSANRAASAARVAAVKAVQNRIDAKFHDTQV